MYLSFSGTSVGTVLASDDDLTLANNEITYTLSGKKHACVENISSYTDQ